MSKDNWRTEAKNSRRLLDDETICPSTEEPITRVFHASFHKQQYFYPQYRNNAGNFRSFLGRKTEKQKKNFLFLSRVFDDGITEEGKHETVQLISAENYTSEKDVFKKNSSPTCPQTPPKRQLKKKAKLLVSCCLLMYEAGKKGSISIELTIK